MICSEAGVCVCDLEDGTVIEDTLHNDCYLKVTKRHVKATSFGARAVKIMLPRREYLQQFFTDAILFSMLMFLFHFTLVGYIVVHLN